MGRERTRDIVVEDVEGKRRGGVGEEGRGGGGRRGRRGRRGRDYLTCFDNIRELDGEGVEGMLGEKSGERVRANIRRSVVVVVGVVVGGECLEVMEFI